VIDTKPEASDSHPSSKIQTKHSLNYRNSNRFIAINIEEELFLKLALMHDALIFCLREEIM